MTSEQAVKKEQGGVFQLPLSLRWPITLEDQDLLEALWEKARIYDRDRTFINKVASNVT